MSDAAEQARARLEALGRDIRERNELRATLTLVVEALVRIEQRLAAMPVAQPSPYSQPPVVSQGYPCARCGTWTPYGTAHYCATGPTYHGGTP